MDSLGVMKNTNTHRKLYRRTLMKIMVGIDLHSNNALCALMEEDGRRLLHQKLPCGYRHRHPRVMAVSLLVRVSP